MLRFVGVVFLLVLVAASGYWAGQVALQPPDDPLTAPREPVRYVVEVGSVGHSFSFTAMASWDLVPVGRHAGTGVVTSVALTPGELVGSGEVVYTVGLQPVVVALGDVPMFRSLGLRTKGPDVFQLQTMLTDLGFFNGDIDGNFGRSTRVAVRSWQDSLGVQDDGRVGVGDIVFVASLPGRLVLGESVTRGARLGDGEITVFAVVGDPEFRVPLSSEQGNLVPLLAEVIVTYPGGVWNARIERAVEIEPGRLDLVLVGLDGGSVCGVECAKWVSLEGGTMFRSEIVVIPDTSGPVVPVGAITVDAGNRPSVTLTDGSLLEVTIVESADGLAVVEGIDAGTEILLPLGGP